MAKMDMNVILIGAGVLALAGLLVFLLMSASAPKCDLTPPEGYVYGIGEGTGANLSEARAAALSAALSELSNKLMTNVTSERDLEKFIVAETAGGITKKTGAEALKVKISLKSILQISRYKTKECTYESGGRKHVKILVYMHPAYAKTLVRAYAYAQVIRAMAENNMCFTGHDYSQKLKQLSAFIEPVPAPIAEASKYMERVEECYTKASSILSKMRSIDTSTPEGYMEFLSYYSKLSKVTSEIPDMDRSFINDKLKTSKGAVALNIKGPQMVVEGQRVVLSISLDPKPMGSYSLGVKSSGCDFPEEVIVEDGKGKVEGSVARECEVEVGLGILKASWKPAVYKPTIKGVVKALLAVSKKPAEKVVILPGDWSRMSVVAAEISQDIATSFGWKIVVAEDLAREFDEKVKNFEEGMEYRSLPAVYVTCGDDGCEFSGDVVSRVSVRKVEMEDVSVDPAVFAKAAVMSGNFAAVESIRDPFIKGVVSYLKGNLDDAARYFEEAGTPRAKLALARVLYEMGDYKKSIDMVLQVRDTFPERAYTMIAQSLSMIEDPMYLLSVMRVIKQAVSTVRGCHAGYYAGAVLLESFGNYEEAQEWILKALDIAPDEPKYLIEYVRILIGLGDKDEAKKIVEKLKGMKLKPSQQRELSKLEEELK